ncbi:MAG TPA: lamin tail domain-containing protein [Anaerolineales bacterium]
MGKKPEEDKKKPQSASWMKDPVVIAAFIGVVGTIIAGFVTGGFGLLETVIDVQEPIRATQAKEFTLTAAALVQVTNTPTGTLVPTSTATLTQTATPTFTPEPTQTASPTSTRTLTPTATHPPAPTPTETPAQPMYSIAITEVMGNPCGEEEDKEAIYNEYIELFNYGDQPVDVEGLWISDGNDREGNPDRIVPWSWRETDFNLGSHVITAQAVIQPNGYAVILSPRYVSVQGAFWLQYLFPRDTVILTIENGSYIGDDKSGISIWDERDPVILYTGNQDIIEEVISTYGTPRLTGNPRNIKDDDLDGIPLRLADCFSAERLDPLLPDQEDSWIEVQDGTPGRGPNRP